MKNWKMILKKIRGIMLTFVLCFVIPFLVFFVTNTVRDRLEKLEDGYTLCGVDLSRLDGLEAERKIENALKECNAPLQITLYFENKTWTFTEKDFDIKSDIHIVLEKLQQSSRHDKIRTIRKIKAMGFDNKIATNFVLTNLGEKLDKVAQEIDILPSNADANFDTNAGIFVIKEEKKGRTLDKEKVYDEIVNKIKTSSNIDIELSTKEVLPEVKTCDIKRATKKQSEFSTSYVNSNVDRKNNVKLAVETLTGYKVLPGETFSFNKALGKRTVDKGYKEANIIKDGAFVKGVGGGVCQVSSTLYNALLLANIEVTEAHKHSLPVSYVEPCLDAMVSWGTSDLKFVNTSDLPVFITGKADGKNIKFSIYGDTNKENLVIKTKGVKIKTIPAFKDKIIVDKEGKYADKIMFKGEFLRIKKAKDGYEAKSFIEYYKDGKLVKTKQLRHATYDAQQGILYEGASTLPDDMTLPKSDTFILSPNSIATND